MKFVYKSLAVLFVFVVTSCQFFDLEKQDSPNAVTPNNAGVDFLYNNIQLSFNGFFRGAHGNAARLSRMLALQTELYQSAYGPNSWDGIWNNAYAGLLPDMSAMEVLAEDNGLPMHIACSQIMRSYTLTTLVDLFGDVPFTQANQGTDFISPTADSGQSIYTEALNLLDNAITLLEDNPNAAAPAIDIFYDGDKDNWIALANTLKLRIYLNTRLVDGSAGTQIANIVNNENIIDSPGEDFEFQYGTSRSNPNNRHPDYNNWYENNDGAYMSNWYMYLMLKESKADVNWNTTGVTLTSGTTSRDLDDPRVRFYFYRQDIDLSDQDDTEWSCFVTDQPDDIARDEDDHIIDSRLSHFTDVDPNMPYCYTRLDGYWGRDHGNGEGIPPDGNTRTAYGLYPMGGDFDDNLADETQQAGTTGALGNGINPIMLSSYVDFMRAEAALTAGTGEDARALLESGMRDSFDKVFGFSSLIDVDKVVARIGDTEFTLEDLYLVDYDDQVDDYVDDVLDVYDAADADGKLDILMEEYFIALWGNGFEAYNGLRRSSKPSRVQPMLQTNPGVFYWSAYYPAVHVDRNQNVTQKALGDKVFWDNTAADAVQ